MSTYITRRFEFDAGHRVYKHGSKCANVHGHRYVVEIAFTALLDHLGMVIDFGTVKSIIGSWIDEYLDHGMILFEQDPLVSSWSTDTQLRNHKRYVMDSNPTAENIAKLIYDQSVRLLEENRFKVYIEHVRIWETPNCTAIYRPDQVLGNWTSNIQLPDGGPHLQAHCQVDPSSFNWSDVMTITGGDTPQMQPTRKGGKGMGKPKKRDIKQPQQPKQAPKRTQPKRKQK